MNKNSNQRLLYLDVAKGLLILSVILHHLLHCLNKSANCADNDVYRNTWNAFMTFIVPFFMPCFFICSGIVSNFNKNLKDFVSSSSIMLLVPATIIGRGGWFISAMFIARIIYWWVRRIAKHQKTTFILLIACAISACVLFRFANVLNTSYILHAMGLAIYFYIGHIYNQINRTIKYTFTVAYFVITLTYFFNGVIPPHITNSFDISICNYPIHFIMAVGGSIFLIELSKIVQTNRIIELFGRNSLVIYLTHIAIIQAIIPKIPHNYLFQNNKIIMSIFMLFILYIFMVILTVSIAMIFRIKPLKWIVGDYK